MPERQKRILVAAIIVSIALRLAAAFLFGGQVEDMPGTADQLSYHTLALRILDGHGFTFGEPWWPATAANAPTAHWSYLYTGYLVLVYGLLGPDPLAARLIQALLVGLLQPLLAYLVGRQVFGQAVGLAAAVLTGLYAYFIYYAANLMTESFYITFILASLYFAVKLVYGDKGSTGSGQVEAGLKAGLNDQSGYRSRAPMTRGGSLRLATGLGLSLGAAVLLRQLFLLIIPFIFLWILWARLSGTGLSGTGRRQVFPLLVSASIVILMILPFTAFNYARFGHFVLLNTNAGYAFFWGNHPIYGTQFKPILPPEMGSYGALIPEELRALDEAALDKALLRQGIQFILDDPQRYVLLSLSRIPAYFMFWPSSDSSLVSNIARVASFGMLWPFMLYGVLRSLLRPPAAIRLQPPSPAFLLFLFVTVYTLIHLLTWTLIRYRLPVDAVLVVFAGLAVIDLVERVPLFRRIVWPVAR